MIYSQHVIWAFVLLVLAFTATYFVLFPFARSTSEAKVDSSSSYTNINEVEEVFLSVPREDSAREHLRYLTSQSHVAGTPGDRLMAQYVHDEMKKAGIPNVSVFDLDVYLNFPKNPPSLTLMSNETLIYRARLSEEILSFDNTSDTFWRNRTFHGYSPSGVVNAPMVFANYGRPQDFELLQKAGVDVRGTICIIRYGKCFRGLKVLNAQTRGAVGVILYSDPQDDGYDIGSEYPDGPWRPSFGVERGSVQFNSLCAGDPMRVDQRYNLANAVQEMCGHEASELIPQIPSLPISHEDALPLLKHMGGKSARDVGGDDFCGGLDVEYTVGPSDGLQLILQLDHEGGTHSIPNVVGIIPGRLSAHQDMPILLGNHRDAWVYGAADPNSGTAALLEIASGLGKLVRSGWKPLRSIYLLSWSGEEYGLLGSTGWAELNPDLIERAVAYLNADIAVSGDVLSAKATPSLATAWQNVLVDLNATANHREHFSNGPLGEIRDANTNWVLNRPDLLGSGSDYAVFLDHFGIASLDFSFDKMSRYGQYHSIYDSFAWMDAYGGIENEPGSAFRLMAFAAKIWGLLALRLADSDILPLDQIAQGKALTLYTAAIEQQKTGLDLSDLHDTVERYRLTAASLQFECMHFQLEHAACNEKLGMVERKFLSAEGLPGRPWFKHILQAPGMYLGYAAEAFPGIQQAIDEGDLELAKQQLDVVTQRIHAAATFLTPYNS